jgi:hypothetical protein
MPNGTFDEVRRYMDHSVPVILLGIDFLLNAIIFNPKHVVFSEIIVVLYGTENMIITIVKSAPVYSIITWDDVTTLWYMLGFIAGTIVIYLILTLISIYKNALFNKGAIHKSISLRYREAETKQLIDKGDPEITYDTLS